MNIKFVYTSIIDKKISSFVQALIEIFNFYFGCVTYGPTCIYGIFLCEDTFFFRQHIITFSFNVFQTRLQVKQSRPKVFLPSNTLFISKKKKAEKLLILFGNQFIHVGFEFELTLSSVHKCTYTIYTE
jgi:hypothetical protein